MIQAGTIDTSYNFGNGFPEIVRVFKQQSDGKILVGGGFQDFDGNTTYYLTRLNTDGSIDNTFYNGAYFNNKVTTIDLLSDGRIVVGGGFQDFDGNNTGAIVILNSDGTLNQSFTPGFNDNVESVKVQSDDKILVGGNFTQYSGFSANKIIRLNVDGTIDGTFNYGNGFNAAVYTIEIESDSNILIGGNFQDYDGTTCSSIIRLNTFGSVQSVFGSGATGTVYAIKIQPNGKIILGGTFLSFNGTISYSLVRINQDGTVDTTFNFNDTVHSIDLQSDGRIVIGGKFSGRFTRLNPSGTIDGSFLNQGDMDQNVYPIILLQNSDILLGGDFTSYSSQTFNRILALNNDVNTYQYQYVYEARPCLVTFFTTWVNYPLYYIGSDIELSVGDIVEVLEIGSTIKKVCVEIISDTNIFAEPTHVYQTTYNDCESCLSTTTSIAIISLCNGNVDDYSLTPAVYVSNLYQVGDIFSINEDFIFFSGENITIHFNDCFIIEEIIPFQGAPIAPIIVEYSPKQSCEECVTCLGRYFRYEDCSGQEGGIIFSHQNLITGTTFYLPPPFLPCNVSIFTDSIIQLPSVDFDNIYTGATLITSTETFQGCEDCLEQIFNQFNWQEEIQGDGTIDLSDIPNVILGPDDGAPIEGNPGWSYITYQMTYNGVLTFFYNYLTNDGPQYDWSFWYVSPNEPNGNLNVDFNENIFANVDGDSGVVTISFSVGDWVTIGVYSTDSVSGPGLLLFEFLENPQFVQYSFEDCNGNTGTITIPNQVQKSLQTVTSINPKLIDVNELTPMPIPMDQDDDVIEIGLPEGFNINFLCGNYSSVFLSTNSYLTFGGGSDNSGFPIPWAIPFATGLPGIYLSTNDGSTPNPNCTDTYVYNWYSGLTNGGSEFVISFEGTYSTFQNVIGALPVNFSFVFYSGITNYFDLYIRDNQLFCEGNRKGGISNGSQITWVRSFDTNSGRSYRFTNNCGLLKANYGPYPSLCGSLTFLPPITPFSTTIDLGFLYTEETPTFDNCNECNFRNVTLRNCQTGEITYVAMSPELIISAETSGPIISTGALDCYEIVDECLVFTNGVFTPNEFYENCTLCLQPVSAGTEYTMCVICCPCTTGTTVTTVSPPHPSWTNIQGKTVVLLDAIQLGGMNGLYS
jgi:uncharacterized delta-60 repeat protein